MKARQKGALTQSAGGEVKGVRAVCSDIGKCHFGGIVAAAAAVAGGARVVQLADTGAARVVRPAGICDAQKKEELCQWTLSKGFCPSKKLPTLLALSLH